MSEPRQYLPQIVTRFSFEGILGKLSKALILSLDTETTGLRVYHGDRLFSLIIATGPSLDRAWYFNFQNYPTAVGDQWSDEHILPREFLNHLKVIFDGPLKLWYLQNAKFDMGMLAAEGITLAGDIHCTKAAGRVEYNEHFDGYSLATQLARRGWAKDDAVEKYITEHKLWTNVPDPFRGGMVKNKHFDRVPFEIIAPYGLKDAYGTFFLGDDQYNSIYKQDQQFPELAKVGRSVEAVLKNEMKLTKTVFKMEQTGVLVDRAFCRRAAQYESDRAQLAERDFKDATGEKFVASPKLFERVFAHEKSKWKYTEKNNPSFDSDVLATFDSPAAKAVLGYREAKSKMDFYQGFLYHADKDGRVHPNFNPDGAGHGRTSSSDPNFQNLTDEEGSEAELQVRRAIIPTPGFILYSLDYKAMEYRFMLEMACRVVGRKTTLTSLVEGGMDVHDATVKLAKEIGGVDILRKEAKISNFLTLYGGGPKKLSEAIKCSLQKAVMIRQTIFQAAPEIPRYIDQMMATAEQRGFIINWLGRRCYFPNRRFAYRAPNYHISGGCADVVKVAMNRIDKLLSGKKSRMTMMVHDELIFEIHESEVSIVPLIQEIMETVYIGKYLNLPTDVSMSTKSLGDLE